MNLMEELLIPGKVTENLQKNEELQLKFLKTLNSINYYF